MLLFHKGKEPKENFILRLCFLQDFITLQEYAGSLLPDSFCQQNLLTPDCILSQ